MWNGLDGGGGDGYSSSRVDGGEMGVTQAREAHPQLGPRHAQLAASLSSPAGGHVAASPSLDYCTPCFQFI